VQEKKVATKSKSIDSKDRITSVSLVTKSPKKLSLKATNSFIRFLPKVHLSIRAKILLSLCIVILFMGTANVLVVMQMLNYSRQYDAIINNITTANGISGTIKPDIDNEMWKIVAGKIQFSEGKQYEIINSVNSKVKWMMDNTDSHKAKVKLDVILRTMQTLTQYVDVMGNQIQKNSTATENESVLEHIRFVTGVVDSVEPMGNISKCVQGSFFGRLWRLPSPLAQLSFQLWLPGLYPRASIHP
jgi:hypothetical protein